MQKPVQAMEAFLISALSIAWTDKLMMRTVAISSQAKH